MNLNKLKDETIGFGVAESFYLLFWILKPFYLRGSGTLQIADVMLAFAFLSLVMARRKIQIYREDKPLFIFVGFTTLINTIYFLITQEISFLLSVSYYIYNIMGVYAARYFLVVENSRKRLLHILEFGLVLQFLLYCLGIGVYEGRRYIGTFNDPNQFGFFVLSSFFIIFVISYLNGYKQSFLIVALVLFLILQSASMGMLSSFLIFILCYISFKLLSPNATKTKRVLGLFLLVLGIGIAIVMILNFEVILSYLNDSNILYLKRISNKIGLLFGKTAGNYSSIQEDRNWQLLSLYPEYMIIGAGQGFYERFTKLRIIHEVHSTWLGILFSYGLTPTIFFANWVYRCIKTLPRDLWCVYIAFFFEALLLVNQRQPAFWTLLTLASIVRSCLRHSSENYRLNGDITSLKE